MLEVLVEMAELFQTELPPLLDEIEAGIGAGDLEAVGKAAHRIKGSAGLLGAAAASSAAADLEAVSRAGDHLGATNSWKSLRHELMLLEGELLKLIAGPGQGHAVPANPAMPSTHDGS